MPNHTARRCRCTLLAGALALLVGCASKPEIMPQDRFWEGLTELCGRAYPGRVVEDSTDSAAFGDRPLTLRVSCDGETAVTMPLEVGGQRWATLVVSRGEGGLTLEHRHAAGADGRSPPSGYGGSTRGTGTDDAQDFYASAYTIALREDAEETVWTLEFIPGGVFQYALRREGSGRRFRAVFDLSAGRPLAGPPGL